MKKEPSDELKGIHSHCFHFVAVGIVSPEEGHFTVLDFKDAVIADRYPVGISAEIFEDPFDTVKRRLTIHHPLLVIERPSESLKSMTLFKVINPKNASRVK